MEIAEMRRTQNGLLRGGHAQFAAFPQAAHARGYPNCVHALARRRAARNLKNSKMQRAKHVHFNNLLYLFITIIN